MTSLRQNNADKLRQTTTPLTLITLDPNDTDDLHCLH